MSMFIGFIMLFSVIGFFGGFLFMFLSFYIDSHWIELTCKILFSIFFCCFFIVALGGCLYLIKGGD